MAGWVDNVVRKQDGIFMIGGGGLSESNNTTDIMYKRDQWERDLSTPLDYDQLLLDEGEE